MQITQAEITPVELKLHRPVHLSGLPVITQVTAIFVRLITRQGQSAWGCTIAHPALNNQQPRDVIRACQECAQSVSDLNPLSLELSLATLSEITRENPAALCAFDMAFYDLLGLAAGMPLYRLLGGYRSRLPTSLTIPLLPIPESVEIARRQAGRGFRIFKIKGGDDPEFDVQRLQAIHRANPDLTLRLDADGGYTVRQALDVANALKDVIEMLEQPTAASDLDGLRQVTRLSPVPVLADQSVCEPASAITVAARHAASGFSIKLASCGGIHNARQVDAIGRAAHMTLMVSCLIEPAMLISAGLSFALSSPNVQYADLDGHFFLEHDPSIPGFTLADGWLAARDVPGLGSSANLG